MRPRSPPQKLCLLSQGRPSLQSPVLFLCRALGSGFLSSCAPVGWGVKGPLSGSGE